MVSPRHIKNRKAWQRIVAKQAADVAFDAECVRVNRGGAIFLVEGLRAFLPGSHLMGRLPDDDLVGQTLPLKFLEVSQEENKLVVSNRRAAVETQTEDLSRGDVIEGVVKALKPYGAYVETGGMSGLLHISQISMHRITNVERVLQPGQRVKCMIIDRNKVNGRTKLSTKTLEREPGDMIKDPARVYAQAEDTVRMYLEKQEAEPREEEADRGRDDMWDDMAVDMDGGSVKRVGTIPATTSISTCIEKKITDDVKTRGCVERLGLDHSPLM
jgi:small subunit ribosomal protein S1